MGGPNKGISVEGWADNDDGDGDGGGGRSLEGLEEY